MAKTSLDALALAGERITDMVDRTRKHNIEYSLTLRTQASLDTDAHEIQASTIRRGRFSSCKLTYSPIALWYI
ncbi:MAG: hypothetical protein AAB288_13995, partial [Acidobacteriota bacterium]